MTTERIVVSEIMNPNERTIASYIPINKSGLCRYAVLHKNSTNGLLWLVHLGIIIDSVQEEINTLYYIDVLAGYYGSHYMWG